MLAVPQYSSASQPPLLPLATVFRGPYKLGYPANSDQWRDCVVRLAAQNGYQRGSVSTSLFGSWGNFGRWGSGSGVGAGVTIGR
jgi:hypothetical protein